MEKGRTIFIGDIHGCYNEFILLLSKLGVSNKDEIFVVGDMINKGPKSFAVIQFCYENRKYIHCIKGNHEMWFLKWLEGKAPKYEGKIFKDLKKKIENEKNFKYFEYINSLPLYIERENFVTLHGGLIPGKNIENHSDIEITRLREYEGKAWYKYYKGKKKIIYGHWAQNGLNVRKNTIGLDSGCVYGNKLSAYILETNEIVQQKALKQYQKIIYEPIKLKILKHFKRIWR